MRLDLVVPVYNEGELIEKVYEKIVMVLGETYDWRVYFVYDYKEDTTAPFLFKLSKRDIRVIPLLQNYGKGVLNALKFAFSKVHDGPVIVIMGDDSDDLAIIPLMLEKYNSGAELVSSSRFLTKEGYLGGAWLKKNLARTAGLILNLAGLGTNDPTNNFKLYSGKLLRQIQIESAGGFEVALELTVKAAIMGHRIEQLPGTWTDRVMGTSNFKFYTWMPHYLRWFFYYLSNRFKIIIKRIISPI